MLYQIYEAQRSLIEPFADMADAAAKVLGNPHTLLGQMPMAQRAAAAYALRLACSVCASGWRVMLVSSGYPASLMS